MLYAHSDCCVLLFAASVFAYCDLPDLEAPKACHKDTSILTVLGRTGFSRPGRADAIYGEVFPESQRETFKFQADVLLRLSTSSY